jgi:hypothetical protein
MRFMHRCDLFRPAPGADRLGETRVEEDPAQSAQSCFYVLGTARALNSETAALVQVETHTLYFPLGTSVEKGQIARNIVNLLGASVDAGPFKINTVTLRRSLTRGPSHIEATLERQ